MFKALLKKQFLEINQTFFVNKKTGKAKKKGQSIRSILIFVLLMIFVCVIFYFVSSAFEMLLSGDPDGRMDWFYFSIEGILAIILGVFGSVFNTMTMLYKAKDNELLLSMPIPPLYILISRMIVVYAMSLLYSALVWIPTVVRYLNFRGWSAGILLLNVILLLFLALLVTVLACIAGWVVALISGKLRNRSFVTVLISLVFFGFYYFVCFRLNTILTTIAAQSEQIGRGIRGWAFPIYELGQGATGKIPETLIFGVICIVLFALCCDVLSRSFIKIITQNKGLKKVEYKEKKATQKSIRQALFGRELAHFTKSSTYMLNCALGNVILLVAAVFAVVYRERIHEVLESMTDGAPEAMDFYIVLITAVVCLTISMNLVTAPSISLEGKSIWLAQSLPVKTIDILHAKEKLHLAINLIPVIIATILIGFAFKLDTVHLLLMLILVVLYTFFTAGFGLRLNLKHPNLNWTNESVPIKQSMPITIGMFGGWGICIVPVVIYYFLMYYLPAKIYLLICIVLLAVVIFLIERWLKGRGSEIFETL